MVDKIGVVVIVSIVGEKSTVEEDDPPVEEAEEWVGERGG